MIAELREIDITVGASDYLIDYVRILKQQASRFKIYYWETNSFLHSSLNYDKILADSFSKVATNKRAISAWKPRLVLRTKFPNQSIFGVSNESFLVST